jgi:hypothetical protein
MSATATTGKGVSFRVLDAMDGPHAGRILRLRLESGDAPTVKSLRGKEMLAVSPDGRRCRIRVTGFAVFGGKPSDDRLTRTGRIDVHVEELDDNGPVGLRWELRPA